MQYDFLKHFPKRMKSVGLYAILIQSCTQKTTWKQYGFLKSDEQINMVFALLRVQLQKIQEAMGKIRRNALSYSVKDYERILLENLDTISDTKKKFQNYREMVKIRATELEEKNINVRQLSPQEDDKLNHLRQIEYYLSRTIDEHQKILNSHFDLKFLYTRELEQLSQLSLIRRFPIRAKLYDPILENPKRMEHLDYFPRPLFNQDGEKIYNLNKEFQLQRIAGKKGETDSSETLDFDQELWQREKEQRQKKKLKLYQNSLSCLLEYTLETGEITLQEIGRRILEETPFSESDKEQQAGEGKLDRLIPNVEILKEIMVELIKNREIDLDALRKERSEYIQDRPEEFQLNDMMLELTKENAAFQSIKKLEVYRVETRDTEEAVVFSGVKGEDGSIKNIRCSNVLLSVTRQNADSEEKQAKEQKARFDQELEARKVVLKYLDVEEAKVFDLDHILHVSKRKLKEIEEIRKNLEREEDRLQKEYRQLTQGKTLEIPKDLEEELKNLDLPIVYGMEWLRRNKNTEEENRELIRSHPFLPYGLILTGKEQEKLSEHQGEICTPFPVPILTREKLKAKEGRELKSIHQLPEVSFYLLFNENLLNEEKLRMIVEAKEQQIKKKQEAIGLRQQEYGEFPLGEPVVWETDFSGMNGKELRDFKGTLIRDYNQQVQKRQQAKGELEQILNRILRIQEFQDEFYRKPLEAMLALTAEPGHVLGQLSTTIQSYDSLMEKLEVDISLVEKEKLKIAELLEDYIREVHQNLDRIDANSNITIRERPVKMLKIQLPEWDENEAFYQMRIQDMIDEITIKSLEIREGTAYG